MDVKNHTFKLPQNSPVTMEQTVEALLDNSVIRRTLTGSDFRILTDIRKQTWGRDQAITLAQKNLVAKIVSQYLAVLELHRWPIADLWEPVWRTPQRELGPRLGPSIARDETSYRLTFPWQENFVGFLKKLRNNPHWLPELHWDTTLRCWCLEITDQSREFVRLLVQTGEWQVSDPVQQDLSENTSQDVTPHLDWTAQGWVSTQPELQPHIQQIQNQFPDNLRAQVWALADLGVSYTPAAELHLDQLFTTNQKNWARGGDFNISGQSRDHQLLELIEFCRGFPTNMLVRYYKNIFTRDILDTIIQNLPGWKVLNWADLPTNPEFSPQTLCVIPDYQFSNFISKHADTHWGVFWNLSGMTHGSLDTEFFRYTRKFQVKYT